MPYKRKGKCVYLKSTGKKVGCSKSVPKAKKYLSALHINVKESKIPTFEEFFLLKEEQIFNFDKFENDVTGFVNWVKRNPTGEIPEYISDAFYKIITNNHNEYEYTSPFMMGFDEKYVKNWYKYLSSPIFQLTDSWSQINCFYGSNEDTDGVLHNYYITLKKTKDNIDRFMKALRPLAEKADQFAKDNEITLRFKTHRSLHGFITHNDSIKFYYYDKKLDPKIEKLVRDWATEYNIQISNRTHTYVHDTKTMSYGQILSSRIADMCAKQVRQNPTRDTSDWVRRIKIMLPDLINNAVI